MLNSSTLTLKMDMLSSIFPLHDEELVNEEDVFFWDIQSEPNDLLNSMLDEQPVLTSSAFVKYIKPNYPSPIIVNNGRKNIHRRLIEIVRGIPRDHLENNGKMMGKTNVYSRGFQHMMRERQRRGKLSQSYADLYSMLPYCSKTDKISILQSAAVYVKDREIVKEALLKRNVELQVGKGKKEKKEGQKIKISIADHTSALDSMIGALKRLKEMNVEAMSLQTQFSDLERIAIVNVENKVGECQVQRAVESFGLQC